MANFSQIPRRIRSQWFVKVVVAKLHYYNSAIVALFLPLATFPLPPSDETFRDGSRDVEDGLCQISDKYPGAFDRSTSLKSSSRC